MSDRPVRHYKKVRKGHGCHVGPTEIHLVCRCGKEATITRTDADTDMLIDQHAPGWITTPAGSAACPVCVRTKQFAPPMFGKIHGVYL